MFLAWGLPYVWQQSERNPDDRFPNLSGDAIYKCETIKNKEYENECIFQSNVCDDNDGSYCFKGTGTGVCNPG